MKEWKITLAIGLVIALSVIVTGIAFASYVNATRPTNYDPYALGAYGSYPYTGNPQYPTYPNTPTYPNQPNGPVYPQQPTTRHQTIHRDMATRMDPVVNMASVHGVRWVSYFGASHSTVYFF